MKNIGSIPESSFIKKPTTCARRAGFGCHDSLIEAAPTNSI
jgi:hypothetical protein